MDTITEIIPEDIPEWAKQAMDEGQLWNRVFDRINCLETEVEKLRGEKVEKYILKFALAHMLRCEAIKQGKYHDQDSLKDDLQEIIDSGALPSGWYKLNDVTGIYQTTWDDG